jgi:biopolymer transport protein ExbD
MRLERRLRVKTAIDMTPLVDVILMLVLFFLITSTFKTVPGIQIALPSSSTARPIAQEPLRILVVSESEIHVGSAVADLRGLPEALKREIARTYKPVVAAPAATAAAPTTAGQPAAGAAPTGPAPDQRRALVEGGAGIPYQLLVSVLDALRKEGISAVGLATVTAEAKR